MAVEITHLTLHLPRWRIRAARALVWVLAHVPGVYRIVTTEQIVEGLARFIVRGARIR